MSCQLGNRLLTRVRARWNSSASSANIIRNPLSRAKVNSPYLSERLTPDDLNQNAVRAEYAVRGPIPTYAGELERKLKNHPKSLPFDNIIYSNIGNPQQLGQKPLTFARQVLSLLEFPNLLDKKDMLIKENFFASDAIERATTLLNEIGSVGAYSHSQGIPYVRQTVARFIQERDGGEVAYPDDIFLTSGASAGVRNIFSILCNGPQTGILIPIPQYPLYTATITLQNATTLPYYLSEDKDWSSNVEEIEKCVVDAIKEGIKPTCLVVINPGNPTGNVLSIEAIQNIFTIASKYGLVVFADEVYQENVFEGQKFHSMKKVLRSLQRTIPNQFDNIQLASFHSTSKGLLGECGHRGGYVELIGFTPTVKQVMLKIASISLCPSVVGQVLVDLMCDPPKPGSESYALDQHERKIIKKNHATRAHRLYEMFNSLEGVSCRKPQGAMYMFPRLQFPFNAIKEAQHRDKNPDEFYCMELLKHTGICTVPGSGFGQEPGTYHLRTTFLASGSDWIKRWEEFHQKFHEKYRE